MPPHRRCSECGESLQGKPITAKTCGTSCRAKRSRRLKRQAKEAGEAKALPEHQKEISERVRNETADVAHKVIEEEIRPVVRESITTDTLAAISKMVALTPTAVAAIAEDLAADDAVVRQRAYTLIMKYTVGHHALVQPEDKDKGGDIHVNFNLPRPKPAEVDAEVEEVQEAVEVRECDSCQQEKPETEFVANSSRCEECYEKQQERVQKFNEEHGA